MKLTWLPALALLAGCCLGCTSEPATISPPEPSSTLRSFPATPRHTTVPRIAYGTSVGKAMRRLERAGLRGEEPQVDWPHYVTGTDPDAGTRVEVGSTVRLEIGDG